MAAPSASIVEVFVRNAERTADKLCLRFEDEEWTYQRLRERAESFAAALGAWGLRPGERVALFLGNCPDLLAAYLGTHLAGGVAVPVNTQYRKVELRYIFEDAGVRLCLTDGERHPELERVRGDLSGLELVIQVGPELEDFLSGAGNHESALPDGEDLAVIAYTSGTTGRSKGAMLLHRNLVANAEAVCTAWRWSADDVLLLALPLFHTHGLMVGAHGTFFTGASAELHRKFDTAAVYDALLEGRVTMFFGVPTMYARLIREARAERPKPLRLYVSGSAPLSPQMFEEFEHLFGERILERYGMAETIMNLTNPYDGERRPGTVGQPFPGQEARIVDIKTREPLHLGEIGEIEVRGPHVFAGYWNRPDATDESFDKDGWFRTGDLLRRGGRVLHDHRPVEGVDHQRRIQRVPPRGRGGRGGVSRRLRGCRGGTARPRVRGARRRRRGARRPRSERREDGELLPTRPRRLQEAAPGRVRGRVAALRPG
jgi:malonyl-CoA/methylmalonyl-CoA synthetase